MRIKSFAWLGIVLFFSTFAYAQEIAQWRGEHRDGVYFEDKLLKTWPENGPDLLWSTETIGDGYGSVAVSSDMLFVCGKQDSLSMTYAFDRNGNLLWKTPNGLEFTGVDFTANFPGPRSTPTLVDNLLYVSSGNGRVACLEKQTGKERWAVDMLSDFNGMMDQHGYSESLLVHDSLIFCFPGGKEKNIVALNRFNGSTVWASEALRDTVTYCSPMLIELPARKIFVTFSGHYLMGLDASNGKLLWWHEQVYHIYHQHCNTPVYKNGYIYYLSGEGNGVVKLKLDDDGGSITEVWRNNHVDNVFHGFILLDNYLFATDKAQKLKCLDMQTGQVVDSLRVNRGALIYADGMFVCYSESGDVNLIRHNGTAMENVGKFKCPLGTREHFAHPVISKGVLYLRHGNALMAYRVGE